jgi:hypothetical protein
MHFELLQIDRCCEFDGRRAKRVLIKVIGE